MTPTRDCPPADALLDLLDDELAPDRAEDVRAHIDACDTCRAVVARVLASGDAHRPDVDLCGTVVAERYRVDGKLGAGAMGIVYAAWDERLERRVALKAIAAGTRSRARRLAERLLRESRAMARLRHPNVVAVHDVIHDEGRLFLAMELVDGQTLRQWLSGGARTLPEVLGVLQQAGQGLAAAHSVGLVHRDFKPDNVLVDRDGRVLVSDFGLARSALEDREVDSVSDEPTLTPRRGTGAKDSALTETGAVVGTPAYMAPEQWRGDRVDLRCDVFAFCVVAFEALVGKRPFAGDTIEELAAAKLAKRHAVPWPSGVPKRIRRAVESGLEPDVRARPATMNALLARLQRPPSRALPVALGLGVMGIGGFALASGDDEVAETTPSCAVDPMLESFDESFAIPSPTPEWQRAQPRFAAHIAAWRQAWDDACTTEPTDERERGALELRRSCLEAQARKLVTILELLQAGTADPDEALRSVPAVQGCEGERLGMLRPVPDDPQLRAAVEALRVDIGEAQVEQAAGLLEESELHAAEVVARARELGYAPILADALYLQGTTASFRGQHDVARTILVEAAEAAAAGGHDVVAAETWIFLMAVVGLDLGDIDRGKEYAALARAMLERLGDAPVVPEMQIRWELHHGQLLMMENDYRGALAAFERGLALAQEHDPSAVDQLREAIALAYQSVDRIEDAVALHRVVHQSRLEELGESHPRMVLSHLNLSSALHAAGRYDEALQHTASVLALAEALGMSRSDEAIRARLNRVDILRMGERYEEALVEADELREILSERGPLSAVLAPHLESNAALVYFDLGRYDDAVAASRRGLAMAEETMPDAEVTNFLRLCLADSLAELGQTEEALELAERAVRIQRAATGADPLYRALAEQSLGNVLLQAGRVGEAVTQLEKAVALFDALDDVRGTDRWAKAQLARALWEAGQREHGHTLAVAVYPDLDAREREEFGAWASAQGMAL